MGKKNIICRYVDTFDYQTIVYVKLDLNTYRIKVLEGISFIPFVSANELKRVKTVKDLSKLLGTEIHVEDLKKIDEEPQDMWMFERSDEKVENPMEGCRANYTIKDFKKVDIYGVADTFLKLSKWKRWINIEGRRESGKTVLAMFLAYLNCNEFMSDQVLYINWKELESENEEREALTKSLNAIQNFCKVARETMISVPITESGFKRPSTDAVGCRNGIREYTIVIDDCYCFFAEEHPLLRIINEAIKDGMLMLPRLEIPQNVRVITVGDRVKYSSAGTIDLEKFKLNIGLTRKSLGDNDEIRKMLKLLCEFTEKFRWDTTFRDVKTEFVLAKADCLTEKDLLEYFECTYLDEIKSYVEHVIASQNAIDTYRVLKTEDGLYELETVDEHKKLEELEVYNHYLREIIKLLKESGLGDDEYIESVKKDFYIDVKELAVEGEDNEETSESNEETSEGNEETDNCDVDTEVEKAAAFLDV